MFWGIFGQVTFWTVDRREKSARAIHDRISEASQPTQPLKHRPIAHLRDIQVTVRRYKARQEEVERRRSAAGREKPFMQDGLLRDE